MLKNMRRCRVLGNTPKDKNNWDKVIIPVSFNLDEHLRKYPPFEGFEAKKMLYIMSLIYLIPS